MLELNISCTHPPPIVPATNHHHDTCTHQNTSLLGGSGGDVNSLDFCPALLKSLGCFYFQCVLSMEGGDSEFANLRILHCQDTAVVRMCLATSKNLLLVLKDAPKHIFFTNSWSFGQQHCWHLYCFATLGSTSIVIHSVKQRLLRNRPRSDAVTSHYFLRERLQRAFTCANQLHWTA